MIGAILFMCDPEEAPRKNRYRLAVGLKALVLWNSYLINVL